MEAKKQIWGVGENMGTEESKKIWEENAQFWDNAMGDESNEFHREVVRPKVTELLSPNPADYILDIACGNGNYSSYLAQRGASVVAFDYSKKMIELAKRRQSQYAKQIEFCVADATDRKSILELKRNRAFTKAVSNMAIMDITDIEPLLMAVYELLQESGIFVFATQHPCFVTLTEKYMTPHSYYDVVIERLHVEEPEHDPPSQVPAENFRITDDHLGEGGSKAKFRMNVDAIRTLQEIEAQGRSATPAEQEVLSRYVGWGGLADAFDESKPGWANEYQELLTLLTPEEYASARASTLNAHYTSPTVIRAIYEAVGNMGFTAGNILEPACGVGNFFGMLPAEMSGSRLYGVELDSISGRIAKQLYPKADITTI